MRGRQKWPFPAFAEQQIWMHAINTMDTSICDLRESSVSVLSDLGKGFKPFSKDFNFDDNSEVSNRPAAQQWAVCTP